LDDSSPAPAARDSREPTSIPRRIPFLTEAAAVADFDLSQKFPDLRKTTAPPTLSSTKGMGLHLLGRRDFDEETRSYVATRWFCLLHIPLIAVDAYRVIDGPNGGWFVLGRAPLSGGAKSWNLILLAAILAAVGFGWWHHHVNTPDYLAAQRIEEADKLAAAGKGGEAARIYREEMAKPTRHASDARAKLVGLVEAPPAALAEAAAVFQVALELERQNDRLVPDLFGRGMALADAHGEGDPRGALALVDAVAPLAPKPAEVLTARRKLLEHLTAADPQDVDAASRLAVVYEAQGEPARCEKLLAPLAARLGERDGAAILGRIRAGKGDFDAAHDLLRPYVRARLPKLHAAERNYDAAVTRVQDQAIADLKTGKAPGFDYDRYDRAAKDEQQAQVQKYLTERVRNDPGIKAAHQVLMEQEGVVAAVLDLGMVLLQRGQRGADPAARKRELEEAEKLFLEVRASAGGTDAYRINLGQVYYWLGKHAEGRKEFDELLAARNREPMVLLAVGHILREVGEVSEARKLTEEAYAKEADPAKKKRAAGVRALIFKDLDDEILWLGRADTASPDVAASLNAARGHKAAADGDDAAAARHLRDAVATYEKMPENAASLNNCALALFALYQVTRKQDDFVRGTDKLDRAVALKAGDSILLHNAASVIEEAALRDVAGAAIDFKTLRRRSGFDLLPYLYADAAGRRAVAERLRAHPGVIKARGHYEKLMILAPKRDDSYASLARLYTAARDEAGLRSVLGRLEAVALDQEHERQELLDFYGGKADPVKAGELKKAAEKQEVVVAATRAGGGATFAAAVGTLLRTKLALAVYGTAADADAVVALAEEAQAAAPSDGTASNLAAALAYRAHRALAKDDPEYAALAKKFERSLTTSLLNYVLGEESGPREKVFANADVKRLLAVRREQLAKLPDERGPGTWALFRHADAAAAARLAEQIRKDPVGALERSINRKLAPFSAGELMENYWALRVAGKDAEAVSLLKENAARGIPLPAPAK
jgi:hypothetical protein